MDGDFGRLFFMKASVMVEIIQEGLFGQVKPLELNAIGI